MSYITGLRIINFGRYKGTHELELADKIYSIVAERTGEPGRSNWCGKSTILYAIRWCMTGIKPRSARVEADVVTKGEKEGGVDIELSDGTFISRHRTSTTDLMVVTRDGVELRKGEAQSHVDAILGVGAGTGANSVWFLEQKEFDRFLTMDPGDRSDMAMRWFGVERFGECADVAGGLFKMATNELASMRARVLALNVAMAGGYTLEQEMEKHAALRAEAKVAEAEYGAAADAAATVRERVAIAELRAMQRELLDRLPKEWDEHKIEAARAAYVDAKVLLADAQKKAVTATRLVAGEFDGQCPVTCDTCPVAGEITANRTRATSQRALALADVTAANAKVNIAKMALAGIEELVDVKRRANAMAVDIRSMIESYLAFSGQRALTQEESRAFYGDSLDNDQDNGVEEAGVLRAAALERFNTAHKAALEQGAVVEQHRQRTADRAALEQEQTKHEYAHDVARWVVRVFGKTGVTKTIITEEFGEIETAANALLAKAGIDLGITIQWGREMPGYALGCDTCGHVYGAKATPKSCPVCSSLRPRKTDDKLFVEATDTSGGADNLAGSAVQMAVGAYLRQRGGCELGVICIDEPFGALDEHNRTSLASTISSTLDTMLLEQAFIISHTADTADATPGRIMVTATGDYSTVAVVE